MPGFPYPLSGKVYDTDTTTALASVRVLARNERTNETQSQNTNSSGDYQMDAANFTTGYADADVVTISVLYTNSEDTITHVIVAANGGATGLDLTLVNVPASDQLRYFTVQDFYDYHSLQGGGENTPATKEVVKVGVMVESDIDETIGTRYSNGDIEVDVNDCDATTNWSGSTDAVAVTVSTDDADYKTKTGGLDLGKSGTTEAFFTYTNSAVTSRSFENRYVCFFVKLASLTGLRTVDNGSAIQVRYGTDGTNYYQKTWYYNDLIAGWNFLYFKIGDREVTTSGSPTVSDMQYFQIRFDTAAASTTVTAGNFVLDNIFVTHKEHLMDEYLDTISNYYADYFASKKPIDRMLKILINRADTGFSPAWDEVTEIDDEVKIDYSTGRISLIKAVDTIAEGTRVLPSVGNKQVRLFYLYGKTSVPNDIKLLSILKVTKNMMHSSVAKALMRGQDSFRSEHFTVIDSEIDRILSRYGNIEIRNT